MGLFNGLKNGLVPGQYEGLDRGYRTGTFVSDLNRIDITQDRKEAWLIIGDSIGGDSSILSGSLGPETPPGCCYKWSGYGLTELTTLDLNNAGNAYGTQWKQFAMNRYLATGKRCVFVNRSYGGSEFYPNGDNNNWYTSGDNYAPSVADGKQCLNYLGLTKFKGILFCLTGVNDASGAASLANIQIGVNSLFARLKADFPDTPFYITSTGRGASGVNGSTIAAVKGYIKDVVDADPLMHIAVNLTSFVGWGLYHTDDLHPNQAGKNKEGELYDRYIRNEEINKEVRQVINCYYSDLTVKHKIAIKTAIQSLQAQGNWNLIDQIALRMPEVENDIFIDWKLCTAMNKSGTASYVANQYITTPGSSANNFHTFFAPASARKASLNDFLSGVRFGTVNTPAGTAAHAHSANGGNRIFQTSGSSIQYSCNDGTASTYSGETKFANDSEYAVGRSNSTTKFLRKNGTTVDTKTITSSSAPTEDLILGAASGSGAALDAQYLYDYYTKLTGFDHSGFRTVMEQLIVDWNS